MKTIALSLAAALLAGGCSQHDTIVGEESDQPGEPGYALVLDLLPEPVVDVDLLFVIDNSGSMAEEQASLATWAKDALFGTLNISPETQLNLHVAVVSTHVGIGSDNISSCEGLGDGGLFQNEPRVVNCSPPTDRFIIDVDNGDGTRLTNYTGTLDETFACIAPLGIQGCGFEHPLEAMKRALDGSNPLNDGFLRPNAMLAVVIVSDEDDCSASDVAVFDASQNDISDPLGPLSSFRCFEFGVICDGDDPRTAGSKTGCVPRDDSPYLSAIAGYANFLKSLKTDPGLVVVGGIFGEAGDTAQVTVNELGHPQLAESCSSLGGLAYPGIRLQGFLDQFPARSRFASICSEDLSGPLAATAATVRDAATRVPCLQGQLVTPAADQASPVCKVWDRNHATGDFARIASCSESGGAAPCYTMAPDASACGHTASNLSVHMKRDATPAPGTHLLVECLAP